MFLKTFLSFRGIYRNIYRLNYMMPGIVLKIIWDFSGGTVVKNPPTNAGDMGSSPGPGRSHMP